MDPKQQKKTGIRRLLEIAGTKKWWLFASMFLAVIATVVQFVPVVSVYLIIEELAAHAADIAAINRARVYRLGYISLGSVAVFGGLLYAALMLSHIAAFNILYEIRVAIAEKLTRLSVGFFTEKASGEIKKVMVEDVERIELFVAHHIPDITSAIVFPLFIIAYLFVMDWRLAIAALLPFPLTIGIMAVMMIGGSAKIEYRNYHTALEHMNAAVVEYVRGMPVVKVFGTALDSFQRLTESVLSYRDWAQKMTTDYAKAYPAFLTTASSSLVFLVPAAVFLLRKAGPHAPSIPTVLLFMIVGGGFFFPLLKLMFMVGYLNQISIGMERIDAILCKDEIVDRKTDTHPADASIEFDHVSFAYNESSVLDRVSFAAQPGTVTALVGPSGAGKTTLGLLTARFWDVQSGAIRIGGVDIRDMSTEALMNQISFVFQDGFLFFDTIEENIRMGNAAASKADVIQAAQAAQCHDFIERLPHGYQTLVGEGGTYLSGGEQQRIGIARAILKNTPIVVLDEATAYADPENEGKILQGFATLLKDKTVLIIAHRLSTVTNADQILVIDRGKVAQRGRHADLIKAGGLYKNMWETYSRAREWTIARKGGNIQ
ncbi:MAG: ABC transporter ATP-binding protein [Candidatus Vecturithrix sp.]|jgi:ATP-binding cassette subfamily B protein|nr:ABC transporter ATP-binding protein [Candidatus Vecturithrix sp.]